MDDIKPANYFATNDCSCILLHNRCINCWGKLDQISFLSTIANKSIHNKFLSLEGMTRIMGHSHINDMGMILMIKIIDKW